MGETEKNIKWFMVKDHVGLKLYGIHLGTQDFRNCNIWYPNTIYYYP